MNILLTAINAKYIHSNLAVYSLRAYAARFAREISLAEYTINHRTAYILQEIYKRRPDVLCFSCYIWNISYVEEVAAQFHKLCPDVPIWVGGPEVSYEADVFLREHAYITGVMVGEGERTFAQLCGYYAGETPWEDICGTVYRDEAGKICFSGSQKPLDLNELPFCYADMTDFENRIVYYESSRGCPFSCSYCLSSVEKSLRFRDVSLVKKELAFFIAHGVPQVKFVDRTFNCRQEHAMEIWRFIRDNDRGITNFHFEIAADLLTEEELALIGTFRPGLIQLEIGVQSTYEPTIVEIHRHMELARVKWAVKRVQAQDNIHQHLDLIAGLPYEDYATFAHSFDEIYALKPEQLQLGFLKVLKGSYMYGHRDEYGIIYDDMPPYEVLATKWLGYADILRIRQVEEMLEVYYNSGQFEVTMKLLELAHDSAFSMFQELGAFYEKNGYFHMNHTRIRRSEILLEYVREKDAAHEPLYREALTMDLYYRENLKSRPSFAPPASTFREQTRRLCKNGKLSHAEPFHYLFPTHAQKSIAQYPQKTECYFVHFDYERRSRLTHQATLTVYREPERMGDEKL